ncbi:hypothetical protein LAZ67_3003804 [Cordylochernes scorpioides]|uniref:CCHC-type domain-containing protein n=1 Tax=Cordylochernes scorpioides TaxID=51811 RepID=A0ABY6K928_9ARAC|nr:hypothetical protein LAZ67_3003804 [Cordylochernes scorpioides]
MADAQRNWADYAENVNSEEDDSFTDVKGRKRRRDSPDLPAMAAQSNSAGASRRQRPSTGRMPQVQEIRTTRAHVMEARARQASCTEEQCCFLEFCPEYQTYQYMKALEKVVGSTRNIVQFTKVNGQYLVGLANRSLAERLVREGLEIEGTLLKTFPFRRTSIRVTIGNLPFFVGDAAVMDALSRYGRITSIAPKQLRVGEFDFTDGRREAFILLHDGIIVEMLPSRFELRIKGEPWPAFLTHGVKCSKCRGQGHRRANCPQLHGRPTTSRRASPPPSTSLPPSTAPGLPRRTSAAPPAPAPPSPAMEVCSAPPVARAVLHPSAPRPSPPAAPALPMEETPSAPPLVTPAPSLQAPEGPVGPRPASSQHPEPPPARPEIVAPRDPLPAQKTLGPAAPTPDVEMSIVEETSASSTSAAKNATRVDLDEFIERHPTVSFARTDALGLGREKVLDLLSSRTKAQRKGPLLSPPQCDALAGLIRQILDLRPGAASNLYKVLGQVKAELRTTPAAHTTCLRPLYQSGIQISELIDAVLYHDDRMSLMAKLSAALKNVLAEFLGAAIEQAQDCHPDSVPPILVTTLDEVVKVVNYIKSNALRSRIFSTFCEAMDSDYKNLLFHTEVRWLSKGKVLNRFISMKNEIMAFIDNEEINFPFMMSDVWWLRVSFLGDIFDKLNSLNLNLQGAQENIITISTKLKAFKEKLSLWNLNIAKENFASFPMVQENPSKSIIKKEVEETLTLLSASFDKYFPYLDVEKMEWVVNPFMHCEIQHLEEEMQENSIDLKNDLVFKRLFTEKELSEFWLCLNSKFPKLSNAAIESLLPFGSSYLCEQGFSTLTEMKSKKRERLQMIDEEMRVCLSQCDALAGLIRQILDLRPGAASNLYKVLGQVKAELRTTPAAVPTPPPTAPRPAEPMPPTIHREELTPPLMTPPPPAPTDMEEDDPMTEEERCTPPLPALRLAESTPPTPLGEETTLTMAAPPPPLSDQLIKADLDRECLNQIRSSGSAEEPGRPSIPAPTGGRISSENGNQKIILKENSENRVYANPPAGVRDVNLAAARDVKLNLPAGTSSNGAARVLGNWADCIEDLSPGAEDDFNVVKTKKRRRESSNSPTAAAPSSNSGGARSSRRLHSSARSVPRAQEIPTTRTHITEARARQASSSEEHCVYLEHGPELQPFHYLRALDRLLGGTAGIIQISKVNGHQLLGLANRGLAERLINNGLEVEGTLLRAFYFRKRAERITVGNLPFFVEDSAIIKALGPYGRITSIAPKMMKAGPYTYTDGRREAFIVLHEGVTTERLPTRLNITIKGEAWPAYLSSGIKCSRCHGQGHRRANCPLLAGRTTAPGPATPTSPTSAASTTIYPASTSGIPQPNHGGLRRATHKLSCAPSTCSTLAITTSAFGITCGGCASCPSTSDPCSVPANTWESRACGPNTGRGDVHRGGDLCVLHVIGKERNKSRPRCVHREAPQRVLRWDGRPWSWAGGGPGPPLLEDQGAEEGTPPCDALAGLIRQILDLRPGAASNLYKVLGQVKAELRTTPAAVPPTPPLLAPRPAEPMLPTTHREELTPPLMTPPPPAPTDMEEDDPITEEERCAPPPPAPRLAGPIPPVPHGDTTTPAMTTPPPPLSMDRRWKMAGDLIHELSLDVDDIVRAVLYPGDREPFIKRLPTRDRYILGGFINTAIWRFRGSDPSMLENRNKETECNRNIPNCRINHSDYVETPMNTHSYCWPHNGPWPQPGIRARPGALFLTLRHGLMVA